MVDVTKPADAITLNSASGAFKSGATVYYKGNAAGSFKLQDAVSDGTSGPASTTFGALTAAGFTTHSLETISTPAGGPYLSTAIAWTSSAASPTIAVHGTDAAGNSQTDTTLTLTNDSSAPTGGAISVPAYATSASVTITSTNYSDGGSGIASNVLTRSNGQSPIGGVCPSPGTFTGSTVVTSPDTGVVDGQCYVYTLTGTDNVGNQASVATSAAVLIDATKPADAITLNSAAGAFKSGTTVYYRGTAAGSFKLQDAVSDSASGAASATFGALSGAGFTTHSLETISTPAGGPYLSTSIAWTSSTASPTIAVHGTDAAGNSQTDTTLTLTNDSTAPASGSISVPAYATTASVTITSTNYTDAGSGIASNVITRSNGQAPTAGVCPASGYTGSTVETSPDTTVVNGQCYLYTLTGTDNVGNLSTVASSPVLVDTTAPADAITLNTPSGAFKSGTTVYYKGSAAGSFKLQDAVTDSASGPASATFGALSGAGFTTHSLETISTPAGGPYLSTAIAWTSSTASPTIATSSHDGAGNASTGTTLTLTNDSSAPTGGSISVPAYATSASVTITSTNYTDAGSGIASNVITRSNGQSPIGGVCPASGYTGSNSVSSPDTTVVDGQCYVYTLTGTDNVGNVATVASSPVLVDTTAPADAITLNSAAGAFKSGTTVYYRGSAVGSFKLQDAVTDSASGPASATFGALSGAGFTTHSLETISTPAGGPYLSTAIAWTSSAASPTIATSSHDGAGNASTGTTLTLTNDSSAPTGGSISVPSYATSASVTITSTNYSDGGSGIASNVITRSNGQSPIGGVCPAVGTFTGSTVVTSPDTGVADGQCYVYTLTGTDNVGNQVSTTSSTVLIDATAPTNTFSLTSATGAFKSGATVYYKGNAAGSFKLHDVVADASSGPASATFGALSAAGFTTHSSETISTPAGGPYDSTAIAWTSSGASPTIAAHGTDAAGNSSADTTFSLVPDSANPTSGSISVPPYADERVGHDHLDQLQRRRLRHRLERAHPLERPGADRRRLPGERLHRLDRRDEPRHDRRERPVLRLHAHRHRQRRQRQHGRHVTGAGRHDRPGRRDHPQLRGRRVQVRDDRLLQGQCGRQLQAAGRRHDSASGAASATFGALSGAGFTTHSLETISTPAGGPYLSTAIAWTSSTASPTIAVHGTDAAGNSQTDTTLTLTNDSTAPASGSISVPAYATTASVTITSTNYTDAGSGIATNVITRSNGQAPTAGVCPASGYTGSTVETSPDTTVVNGQCYLYTLTGTDNVGNLSTVASSPVLVDTTAPADALTLNTPSGAFKSGTTVYYHGTAAGSFKLQDAVTDSASGPASATFGALSGAGFTTHSLETISTPAGGPYLSTRDRLDVLDRLADDRRQLPRRRRQRLDRHHADAHERLERADRWVDFGARLRDERLGHHHLHQLHRRRLRHRHQRDHPLQRPVADRRRLPGRRHLHRLDRRHVPDTTVVDGQCYVYTLTGTDNVGNTSSVTTSTAVLVDATAPADAFSLTAATGAFKTGTTIYYKGTAAGSFKLRDTVTDGTSGAASSTFGALSAAGFTTHSLETISTPAGGPYLSTAIAWTSSTASPTIAAHGTDAAGNSAADTTFSLVPDSTNPTGGSISVLRLRLDLGRHLDG